MVCYLDLPNELRDSIELSKDDLSQLSRTSKSMRHAVLPRLFRNVSMHWEAYKPAPPLSTLLVQILRSPKLAEAVEELHFHARGYGKDDPSQNKAIQLPNGTRVVRKIANPGPKPPIQYKPRIDRVEGETKDLLLEALQSMNMSNAKGEETLNEHNLIDVVIAIITIRCPNLKVLSMDLEFLHQNRFLPEVVSHIVNIGPGSSKAAQEAFTKLARIQVGMDHIYWRSTRWLEFPISSYIPFLYLPALETISAPFSDAADVPHHRLGKHTPQAWPTSPPPILNIRKLDLSRTMVDTTTLEFLVAQMPRLESLRFDMQRNANTLLDCAPLRRALLSVAETLKELTISYEIFVTEAYEETDMSEYLVDQRGIGSLNAMTQLTKLEIALPILMGWEDPAGLRLAEALPPNLEDFCLRDDAINYMSNMWWEEIAIEEVRHWMDKMSTGESTPHMKRFGLRMENSQGSDWSKEHHQTLMDICKAKGLEFWSERQPSRWEWEERDDEETVTDKIRGHSYFECPKSELGKHVRRALSQKYPDIETWFDSD